MPRYRYVLQPADDEGSLQLVVTAPDFNQQLVLPLTWPEVVELYGFLEMKLAQQIAVDAVPVPPRELPA